MNAPAPTARDVLRRMAFQLANPGWHIAGPPNAYTWTATNGVTELEADSLDELMDGLEATVS